MPSARRVYSPSFGSVIFASLWVFAAACTETPPGTPSPQIPALTLEPADAVVKVGELASFSVAASGTPEPAILWQRNGGPGWLDVAGATSMRYDFTATAADHGAQFRAVASNSAGSITSRAATLTVQVSPSITTHPSPQTVTAPEPATFTVVATGLPAPTYQWQRSPDGTAWSDVLGATRASHSTAATSAADHGALFRARATNGVGTPAVSAAATLTVNVAPAITTQPADQTVTAPSTATFAVVATGLPAPTYQWQRSNDSGATWSNVSGASAASHTTPATAAGDRGALYRVVVANGIGTAATSAAATLTVNVVPAFTAQPSSQTVTAPATATFAVAASGLPAPAYQWQRSNDSGATWSDLPSATASSYTTAVTSAADHGALFRARATNGVGTPAVSAAATLTVNVAPAITTQPSDQTVTAPSTATFAVVATGLPAPTYQWQRSPDGASWTDVAGATGSSYRTAATSAADHQSRFRVVASNGIGAPSTSASATLTVNVAPAIASQPTNQTVTAPAPATFTVVATGLPAPTYQWQRSDDSGASWSDVATATGASYTTPATTAGDHGALYRVVASNGIGTAATSATAALTVDVAPAITTAPSSQTVVAPATATFTVVATGLPAPSYQWQSSPDGTVWTDATGGTGATSASYTTPATSGSDNGTRFRVVVSNGVGVAATSPSVTLTVNVPPAISIQPAAASVTVGDPATFTVLATGLPAPSYQWQRSTDGQATWADVANGVGATTASYTLAVTFLNEHGAFFRVQVTNPAGSVTSNAALLSVVGIAPSFTVQPANQYVAAPQTATFTASATGAPAPSYQWQRSDDAGASWSDVPGANAPAYTTTATLLSDHGAQFRVVASNGVGSAVTSAAATLTVNGPAPTIVTQPSNVTVTSPTAASFVVVATGEPALAYQWQRSTDGGGSWSNVSSGTGSTTAQYTTADTGHLDNQARYRVVVSNSGGTLTSSAATVTVELGVVPVTQGGASHSGLAVAIAPNGRSHLVYERSGRVYYRQGLGTEEDLGPGTFAVIAVGPNGVPQVSFLDLAGGAVLTTRTAGTWSTPIPAVTSVGASWLGLDVDSANAAHLVLTGNIDGDSYGEILYTTNAGGSFAAYTVLADGSYSPGCCGTYFHHPSIQVDAAGYWHVAVHQQNWGGRASWSDENIVLWTNDPAGGPVGAGSYPWTSLSLGKASLAKGASGTYQVVFNVGANIYRGAVSGASWTNGLVAAGYSPAISTLGPSIGVTWSDGSAVVRYAEDTGSGFGSATVVGAGFAPVVGLAPVGNVALYFLRTVSGTDQVLLWTDLAQP